MSNLLSEIRDSATSATRQIQINWPVVIAAFALVLAVSISFVLIRYVAYRSAQANFYGQPLVPANDAYNFHLVDQNGKAFQLSQLRGKLVLFSFGFTHCPSVCPTTLSDLAKVYRALPEQVRRNVKVLFVTVDPLRDRPEVIKNYVSYFDPEFLGLTGSDDQISRAASAYGASFTKVHDPGQDQSAYGKSQRSCHPTQASHGAVEWLSMETSRRLLRFGLPLSTVTAG